MATAWQLAQAGKIRLLAVAGPRRYPGELANVPTLREQGIIVRHFKQPRIDQFLRITIGTAAECASLSQTLQQILA